MAKDRHSSSASDAPHTVDAPQSSTPISSVEEGGDRSIPADIAALGYEQARDELASIVATLESGRAGLEESMTLWQRGEHLARHCERWLDAAEARLATDG